jgi:O-antigen ligase
MKQRIESLFTLENLKYFLLFALLLRYNVYYFAPEGFKYAKLAVALVHSICLAWGVALFLLGHLKARPLVTLKPTLPLILFLIGYFVTILTTEFGSISQLPGYFSYILYFFVLAAYDPRESEASIVQQIKIFNNLFIFATFAIALVSLTFYFLGRDITFAQHVSIGVVGGRFSGITGNPNKDAILAALSIFCSFFNFSQYKLNFKTKFLYMLNVFAQIFLLAIGFSRGAALLMVIMMLLIGAFWTREKILLKQSVGKILKVPILAIAIIAIFLGLLKGLQAGQDLIKNSSHTPQAAAMTSDKILGRTESPELSNGRVELWKTCGEIVLDYPLGVGFSNIKDACEKINPSYTSDINSMHNTFFQALVGSGYFGLFTTLAFTFVLALRLWKTLRNISSYKPSQRSMLYLCSTILISLVAYSTYDNGPFFIHNIPNLFFWAYLGYFCYFMNSRDQGKA